MNRIFLLRAYGDFVILLQAILRSNTSKNYSIVASSHLKPLYLALYSFKDMSHLQIEFIDFGINKGQLRLFTNRHFLHFLRIYIQKNRFKFFYLWIKVQSKKFKKSSLTFSQT